MKDYDKNKKSSYLILWDENNSYRWVMLQNLHVNGFGWIENTSPFNEDFIKNDNEDDDLGCFLEIDGQYFKQLDGTHKHSPILPEKIEVGKL